MSETIESRLKTILRPVILCCLFLTAGLSGCYEPIEGCLDAQASNFDFEADKPCNGCCEYPSLRVDFQHKYIKGERIDNLVFSDSVYYDINGHPFKLDGIRFYLSGLRLVRSGGSEAGVEEELKLGIWTETLDTVQVAVEDNFTLVDAGVFGVKEVGTIRTAGKFNRLRFTIGLDETVNRAVIDAFPSEQQNHPLAREDMYWDFDRGYIFNRIEMLRDTTTGIEATVLEIGTAQNLVDVELPIDFEALEGFDIRVTLRIDYGLWFRDIDVKADSETTLIQKIVANVAESFSLVAISL